MAGAAYSYRYYRLSSPLFHSCILRLLFACDILRSWGCLSKSRIEKMGNVLLLHSGGSRSLSLRPSSARALSSQEGGTSKRHALARQASAMAEGRHFGLQCLPPESLIRGNAIGRDDFQCSTFMDNQGHAVIACPLSSSSLQ